MEGAVSHACCCRFGHAPIHNAVGNSHLSCLEWLVARGADIHAQDMYELLMSAMALPLVVAMLLMASIEIAVASCGWLRVDGKWCGCGLFDAVVMVAGAAAVCGFG